MSTKPFIATAIIDKGDASNALFHMPAEAQDERSTYYFEVDEEAEVVHLIVPDYTVRSTDPQMKESLNGQSSGYQKTFPLVAYSLNNAGGFASLVIDIHSWITGEGAFIYPAYELAEIADPWITSVSNFPRNMNLKVNFGVGISVAFSLSLLPDVPMVGRTMDDRVGFFALKYLDAGSQGGSSNFNSRNVDRYVSLIHKWNIKVDSDCKVITGVMYYIDPSVPKRWRAYIKEGVEAWNEAFDTDVFKCTPNNKVIQAILPGEPGFPDDYDAADIRYNSISWAISLGSTFALGPSNIDPRSGEVLNADIVFTSGWVYAYMAQYDRYHTNHGFSENLQRCSHDHHGEYGTHLRDENLLLGLHLTGLAESEMDSLVGAGLKDVTMHEVGHTLGLRHNFKASSTVSWGSIQGGPEEVIQLSSSVMDYVPVNMQSVASRQKNYFSTKIGHYDRWAIRYGYTLVKDEVQGIKHQTLIGIAELSETDEKLVFATDEDDPSPLGEDPYTNYHDMAADPMDYYLDRVDLVNVLRKNMISGSVAPGESYTHIVNAYDAFHRQLMYAGSYAAKFIGGLDFHKYHHGSDVVPVSFIDESKVTKAIELIVRILQDDDLVMGSKEVFPYLVERTGWCEGLHVYCEGLSYSNVIEKSALVRMSILKIASAPTRLERLNNIQWAAESTTNSSSVLETLSTAVLSKSSSSIRDAVAVQWIDHLIRLSGSGCTIVELDCMNEVLRIESVLSISLVPSDVALFRKIRRWNEQYTGTCA